jgi:hypothetical protein
MRVRRAVVTGVLVVVSGAVGVVAGAAGVVINPSLACGDTPGFCSNPPATTTQPVVRPAPARPVTGPVPAPACPECGRF